MCVCVLYAVAQQQQQQQQEANYRGVVGDGVVGVGDGVRRKFKNTLYSGTFCWVHQIGHFFKAKNYKGKNSDWTGST